MSKLLERVARAICRARITQPSMIMYSPEGVEYHVNKNWQEWVPVARAAIKAIEEERARKPQKSR